MRADSLRQDHCQNQRSQICSRHCHHLVAAAASTRASAAHGSGPALPDDLFSSRIGARWRQRSLQTVSASSGDSEPLPKKSADSKKSTGEFKTPIATDFEQKMNTRLVGGSRRINRRLIGDNAFKTPKTSWVEPWVTQDIPADRLPTKEEWAQQAAFFASARLGTSVPLARPQAKQVGEWQRLPNHPAGAELWQAIQQETKTYMEQEPVLSGFLQGNILMHQAGGLGRALASLLANKLSSNTLLPMQLVALFLEAYAEDQELIVSAEADLAAVKERDAACDTYVQPILFFKGFQALQSYRLAHWLYMGGRRELAKAVQNRMSEVFHVDIHPAAVIGRGIMMDHATGVVVGETAVIGDNVSLLHRVTLGGSGVRVGRRHPTIGNGVLLGAAVSVLGPVTVGATSKVGAGSVVMTDLPPACVAVGVPARIMKTNQPPPTDMDQCDFVLDYII